MSYLHPAVLWINQHWNPREGRAVVSLPSASTITSPAYQRGMLRFRWTGSLGKGHKGRKCPRWDSDPARPILESTLPPTRGSAIQAQKASLTPHQPFYTSRCGYRLCARAYLNGDGSGKGTHLSLYFVVMRGEFDSLLQWPFRQRVTLMLLDQSGKKNHIMETFKADPNSSSFKRPDGEMNIASGCPRFVAHSTLESAKNTYIKDDTLFLKVAVDLTDLEDL